MDGAVIRVEGLGKKYRLGQRERYHSLRDAVTRIVAWPVRRVMGGRAPEAGSDAELWALRDVSFTVRSGEVMGVIGRNGAGKSTLLKILGRITEPTEGWAEISGRVGSLLEVGTGFHQELTGRENIYLSGAILGMSRAEIRRRFDEIVAFAEVERFLDTMVKRYSSGMYVRLAFAVSAHLETEILLVDEVLAVGDISFQQKCLGKMGSVARQGRTVLFVSHNMAAVQALCTTACVIDGGRCVMQGTVEEAVSLYLGRSRARGAVTALGDRSDRQGNGQMRILAVTLLDGKGREVSMAQSGEPLQIALAYERRPDAPDQAVVQLAFTNGYGQRLFVCLSRSSSGDILRLPARGQIRCVIPRLPLMPGAYSVGVWGKIDDAVADHVEDAFRIEVVEGDFFGTGKLNPGHGGDLLVEHSWEVA